MKVYDITNITAELKTDNIEYIIKYSSWATRSYFYCRDRPQGLLRC